MSFGSLGDLLLVEPDHTLSQIISFRMELLGYAIRLVRTGTEAQAAIAARSPGLLIVNTRLGDGDGLEWLARIRHEWSQRELPTLVVSLDPSLETVERAFHAGADDYLVTPFDPSVLEAKVHELLQAAMYSSR